MSQGGIFKTMHEMYTIPDETEKNLCGFHKEAARGQPARHRRAAQYSPARGREDARHPLSIRTRLPAILPMCRGPVRMSDRPE